MYSLQLLIGTARTIELLMTGRSVKGEEAFQIGLATTLAEEDSLHIKTMEFANKLANGPTLTFSCQKRLIYESFYRELEIFTDREAYYMAYCSRSDDFAEATNAFLEKRAPVFTGK
jgi:2-(1,2-epoxy-1,2-dihydrophenyl)acetyl-CoA isomerase